MLVRHPAPTAAPRPAARRPGRRGVTLVETCLILVVFLMMLFGIFEYCRFLLVLHVTNNAARDGARYASVNWDKPANFDKVNYTDSTGTVYQSVTGYTKDRMAGVSGQLAGFDVAVYPVDPAGLTLSPPVVRSATLSTATPAVYPDPFAPDANTPPWNQSIFPNRVAVTIKGTYKPVTPVLLLMPSTIPVSVTAMTGME